MRGREGRRQGGRKGLRRQDKRSIWIIIFVGLFFSMFVVSSRVKPSRAARWGCCFFSPRHWRSSSSLLFHTSFSHHEEVSEKGRKKTR
jgi:hypothetical protein